MGTWGYRPEQNDTYSEIIERFQNELRVGKKPQEITYHIRKEMETYPDYCLVKLALMDCLWKLDMLTEDDLLEFDQMLCKNECEKYLFEMGASSTHVSKFMKILKQRGAMYKQPTMNKNSETMCPTNDSRVKKGACFWYRFKGAIYGALILEKQEEDNWLIAITEALKDNNTSMQDVLSALMYTLAWFNSVDILPPRRLHYLGTIEILRCFHNTYGLIIRDGSYSLTNFGQRAVWEHRYWSIRFRDTSIKQIIE